MPHYHIPQATSVAPAAHAKPLVIQWKFRGHSVPNMGIQVSRGCKNTRFPEQWQTESARKLPSYTGDMGGCKVWSSKSSICFFCEMPECMFAAPPLRPSPVGTTSRGTPVGRTPRDLGGPLGALPGREGRGRDPPRSG